MTSEMSLKERYRRFRAWQQNPFDYTNHSEHAQRCANCGMEFSDNFCPRCGQKAGVGPIGWHTVRQGVMLVWGMDSRSLGYSLVQLVLRPGYLIGDYISGKRQVSFPPVKMLLIVAIAMMLVEHFFDDPFKDISTAAKAANDSMSIFSRWADANPGWAMLATCSTMILPTWLYFRHSPKHHRHTLPEGFFIQVFMSSLMVMVSILSLFSGAWVMVLLPVFYTVAYRQLFGYGWWGTLWRTVLSLLLAMFLMSLASELANILIRAPHEKPAYIIFIIVLSLLLLLPGLLIGRKKKEADEP